LNLTMGKTSASVGAVRVRGRGVAIGLAVAVLASLCQPALAQTVKNPTGLTEADIAPCNDFLTYRTAKYRDPVGISNLDLALSVAPYSPLYDLADTREFIKEWDKVVTIMETHDEERMRTVIGVVYTGKDYDDRLNSDRRLSCLLRVRLGQLTGKKSTKPLAAPAPVSTPSVPQVVKPQVPAPVAAATAPAPTASTAPAGDLSKMGAGQLFTRADELDEQGKTAEARGVRRTLIARFPGSPLATTAAQQLAAKPAGGH
jgi:hypothetical protein